MHSTQSVPCVVTLTAHQLDVIRLWVSSNESYSPGIQKEMALEIRDRLKSILDGPGGIGIEVDFSTSVRQWEEPISRKPSEQPDGGLPRPALTVEMVLSDIAAQLRRAGIEVPDNFEKRWVAVGPTTSFTARNATDAMLSSSPISAVSKGSGWQAADLMEARDRALSPHNEPQFMRWAQILGVEQGLEQCLVTEITRWRGAWTHTRVEYQPEWHRVRYLPNELAWVTLRLNTPNQPALTTLNMTTDEARSLTLDVLGFCARSLQREPARQDTPQTQQSPECARGELPGAGQGAELRAARVGSVTMADGYALLEALVTSPGWGVRNEPRVTRTVFQAIGEFIDTERHGTAQRVISGMSEFLTGQSSQSRVVSSETPVLDAVAPAPRGRDSISPGLIRMALLHSDKEIRLLGAKIAGYYHQKLDHKRAATDGRR